MREIELKILEVDPEVVIAKLESFGAKKIAERMILDKQFDTSLRDIGKKDELLRIRRDGEQGYLTFKTNKIETEHIRSSDEFEVTVDDIETTEKIITGLGFVQVRYREKYRTSYQLDGVTVEIEKYPTIPYYIELEGAEADITAVVEKLGFTMASTVPWTATKVLRHYGQDPNHQIFKR